MSKSRLTVDFSSGLIGGEVGSMHIGVGLDERCEFPRSIKVQTKAKSM